MRLFYKFLGLLLCGFAITAQTPQPIKIGDVVFSGSLRSRFEVWDWFETPAADGSYGYSGNILRFGFSQTKKNLDWQLEFAAPFLLALPDNAIASGAQGQLGNGAIHYANNDRSQYAGMVFPKQGFVRFKGLFGSEGQNLRLGRFEFSDAGEVVPKDATLAALKRDRIAQRLIGPFAWTHVGRSYDGFQYNATNSKLNFTLMGALPTRGVFQTDGWGNLKVGVVYAALTGQLGTKVHRGEWRALGIYYHDWRHVLKTDNRPQAVRAGDLSNIRVGTFGGHYLHASETPAGTLDFIAWGVLQAGRWGRIDHSGQAGFLEAGWQPKFLPRLKPWLRGGFSHTSGDANPNDNKHDTFFQILPTPRPFARFPFFDMVNNEDAHVSLAVRPGKALVLRSEIHWLRLSERNDQWMLGGGAFSPWVFGYVGRPSGGNRGLANLYDISADYTLNPRWSFSAYYGYAAGHSVIRSLYPQGENGSLGYLEATVRF